MRISLLWKRLRLFACWLGFLGVCSITFTLHALPEPEKIPSVDVNAQLLENEKININKASLETLTQLTGIGTAKAQAIVDYRRTQGDFVSLEEITEIKGIGKRWLELHKHQLTL